MFGGGTPLLDGTSANTAPHCVDIGSTTIELATSGSLGLNNNGDEVTLYDTAGLPVAAMVYGGDVFDQSHQRIPELDPTSADYVEHSVYTPSGALQSPGTLLEGGLYP